MLQSVIKTIQIWKKYSVVDPWEHKSEHKLLKLCESLIKPRIQKLVVYWIKFVSNCVLNCNFLLPLDVTKIQLLKALPLEALKDFFLYRNKIC